MINQAVPFENELYVVELKGKTIKEFVRTTTYNLLYANGINSFPAIYGGKFRYNATRDILVGSKVLSGGDYIDIEDNIIYNVVLSSYVYKNEKLIADNAGLAESLGITDREAFIDYVKNNSPLSALIDSIIIY